MAGGWGVKLNGYNDVHNALEEMGEMYEDMGTYVVVSDVRYAVYVEFGTSKMAANGALRKSAKATLANIDNVVASVEDPSQITQRVAEDIAEGWRQGVWVDTGRLRNSITVEEAG